MSVKITQTVARALPPMLGEPHFNRALRCGSERLLAALVSAHPHIVTHLTAKNGKAHNHA